MSERSEVSEDDYTASISTVSDEIITSEDDESDGTFIGNDEDLKSRLQDCLDAVHHDGTFSAFYSFKTYVNPGLEIANYGLVGLPLPTRDAEAIARLCKQSPFGKGAETLVDTSVRKTWELDGTQFECRNPVWSTYLTGLLDQVTEALGVKVACRAERYKLLLYEEGAFFKPHKDSEKAPGMFGTLVICLPSEHTGGQVRLVHGKEERVLETAKTSSFDLSALAWYSDVQHEVQPIRSGHRLVITYNLVQDLEMPKQTAAALDASHYELERLLHVWKQEFKYLDMLVYPLGYQYTEASLCLKNLKGSDAAKGRYLDQLCSKAGFYWFLGRMTKETVDYDYDEEEDEVSHTFDYIVTPTGRRIKLDLLVSEEDIIVKDLYADRGADSEEEGEFTGNEGANPTYRYHDTVVILLRKEELWKRFSSRVMDPTSLDAHFQLIEGDVALSQKQELESLALDAVHVIVNRITTGLMSDNTHRYTYSSVNLQEWRRPFVDLFTRVVAFCNANGQAALIRNTLHNVVKEPKWSSSIELVQLVASHVAQDWADQALQGPWAECLSYTATALNFQTINSIRTALELIKSKLNVATATSFQTWMNSTIETKIVSVTSYDTSDVAAILDLIPSLGSQCYFEKLLPKLDKKPNRFALVSFLGRLYSQSSSNTSTPDSIVKSTYEKLIPTVAAALKMQPNDFTSGYTSNSSSYPSDILNVLLHTIALGLENVADQLIKTVLPDLPGPNADWANWKEVFQFVRKLTLILEKKGTSSAIDASRKFIQTALQNPGSSFQRQCPVEPKDWRRTPQRSCGCGPCQSLNRFLLDPYKQSEKFQYAERTRKHLQYNVPHGHLDYKFETEKPWRGSSHILVIYKTNNEFRRLIESWNVKVNALRLELANAQTKFTMKILGGKVLPDGSFVPGVVASDSTSLLPVPPSVQNHRATAPVAGIKRKAEVIDLTEDMSDSSM